MKVKRKYSISKKKEQFILNKDFLPCVKPLHNQKTYYDQHLIKYADPILRGSGYFYGILNNAAQKDCLLNFLYDIFFNGSKDRTDLS